jgi:hypothetical protein
LESDVPPKRLRLGPLKGWGIERDGVNMSAVEYAQKHWSEVRDEYPEMLPAILPDIDDQYTESEKVLDHVDFRKD